MNTKRGIIGLGLLAAGITPMWAQDIKGVVIDQKSKETLIGAVITAVPGNGSKNATQEKDGIKAVTDIDGNFSLQNLKDGTYTLYIKYVGYKTQKIDGVQLKGGKWSITHGTNKGNRVVCPHDGYESSFYRIGFRIQDFNLYFNPMGNKSKENK